MKRAAHRQIATLRLEDVAGAFDQPRQRYLGFEPLNLVLRDACHGKSPLGRKPVKGVSAETIGLDHYANMA